MRVNIYLVILFNMSIFGIKDVYTELMKYMKLPDILSLKRISRFHCLTIKSKLIDEYQYIIKQINKNPAIEVYIDMDFGSDYFLLKSMFYKTDIHKCSYDLWTIMKYSIPTIIYPVNASKINMIERVLCNASYYKCSELLRYILINHASMIKVYVIQSIFANTCRSNNLYDAMFIKNIFDAVKIRGSFVYFMMACVNNSMDVAVWLLKTYGKQNIENILHKILSQSIYSECIKFGQLEMLKFLLKIYEPKMITYLLAHASCYYRDDIFTWLLNTYPTMFDNNDVDDDNDMILGFLRYSHEYALNMIHKKYAVDICHEDPTIIIYKNCKIKINPSKNIRDRHYNIHVALFENFNSDIPEIFKNNLPLINWEHGFFKSIYFSLKKQFIRVIHK